MTRREQLADLDRLTTALLDGTDRLSRRVAAVEREVSSWRWGRT